MPLRLAIILFSLSSFALVGVALFQLAGPTRSTSRFAHSITGIGVVLDSRWVELRFSKGEGQAKRGEVDHRRSDDDLTAWGFEFATRHGNADYPGYTPGVSYFLRVPVWAIDAALAFAIVATFIAVRRAARRAHCARQNQCPTCGYDLRATPEQCPECGAKSARAVT